MPPEEGLGRLSRMVGGGDTRQLREGLRLVCLDQVCPEVRRIGSWVPGACMNVVLTLEGNARLHLGRQSLPMAVTENAGVAKGFVVYLDTPEPLEGAIPPGVRQRSLVITIGAAWFGAAARPSPEARDHLRLSAWQPTPRALAIAEQLLCMKGASGLFHELLVESRVLELVAEALAVWEERGEEGAAASPGLHPNEYARVGRLRALIESGEVDQCSLDEIAARMGCNATSLQQQFRMAYGRTIIDYLRISRLQRAANALQSGGVSVARAAEIAGYASQANFSTAFRRQFGLVPKHYRVRI